ncbi:EscU/YscU/HrcU family type III secretion system export apparatus switch protein [Robertmurraya yapensis]|uniref:EscU/YscU/HrcU family type III secretion system export apparatus switch protein n=1 Tax=Bacillus yapensis TaxID=2492960 RepID=A0A3S0K4Q7_9BACI|nr:EscU/YscU/HrcU family type III secretion system export apparatus switch protein [Bacillus yapensis]RTR35564.1 EscU/YscU/HrcU family type III secretion system export apparatus switch protein [Bacillus yapensis]TKS98365.1 EscU/YscU/HrcU family type III secretion system export apparatus switch protein [Bacillus yapensis]
MREQEERHIRKEAIALGYDSGQDEAPRVLAKGTGLVADNILEKAVGHDVPIQEDASLVELLGKLNINETIPEELYQAVAEVFAFIYRTNKEVGHKKL